MILGAYKGGIQRLQFWAGSPLARLAVGILGEPGQHTCSLQQFEVVGKRDGVSGVRKLADHLLIRQNLSGVSAAEKE